MLLGQESQAKGSFVSLSRLIAAQHRILILVPAQPGKKAEKIVAFDLKTARRAFRYAKHAERAFFGIKGNAPVE
ncbi:MAG: hypothetical protein A2010_12935 [Nitrospirae bacterium GWD2_57_9]|nr:MAG: hypothetical protein A2010_12935 [Nitrospirae bacterium GWD2_57_9]